MITEEEKENLLLEINNKIQNTKEKLKALRTEKQEIKRLK